MDLSVREAYDTLMKRSCLVFSTLFVLLTARARAEEAVAVQPEPVQTSFVIVLTTEFNGKKVVSVASPEELKEQKKILQAENDAARKAYREIKSAWYDRYDKPVRRRINGKYVYVRPTIPDFPMDRTPVKEIKQLEVCKTEEAANERMTVHQMKADEGEDTGGRGAAKPGKKTV